MAVTVRSLREVVGSGTSPTLTEPAGAANGDVLIALSLCVSTNALTRPTGWTELYAGTQNAVMWNVSWVQRGGSAPSLTWTHTGTIWREVFIVCLQGAAAITLDSQSAAGTSLTATNPDPPATTAVAATSLAIAGGLNWNGSSAGGYTVSSGYTVQTTNTQTWGGLVQSKALSAAGVEDPNAFTNATSSDVWNGFTVTFTDAGAVALVAPRRRQGRPFPFTPGASRRWF